MAPATNMLQICYKYATHKMKHKELEWQLIDFIGSPYRNRTCNCPLGGGRYIHLTKRPRLRWFF